MDIVLLSTKKPTCLSTIVQCFIERRKRVFGQSDKCKDKTNIKVKQNKRAKCGQYKYVSDTVASEG